MKPVRACIFDLDGVVVDTAPYHYLAWKRLAAGLGFDFTPEDNERLKGVSRMESLRILLSIGGVSLDETRMQEMADLKNAWYLEHIGTMTPAFILPGVTAFIAALRSEGIRIAIGTSSRNAGLILERIRLDRTFDAVIDGNRVDRAKPDPAIFLEAARALGTAPADCLVFEDATAGIESARRAGMKVIGVGNADILGAADRVISGFESAGIDLIYFD